MANAEKMEHFITTDSNMKIHMLEKRLKDSEKAGPAKPVLLIHGVGVGYAYFDVEIGEYSMMNSLVENGFHVFAVDQRLARQVISQVN